MKRMKSKKSNRDPERSVPSKDPAAVFPCFHCGLIFARRSDYRQHNERYHQQNQDTRNDRFKCHECPQTFGDDEKAFNEHLLFHDLATVIGTLRRSEMAKKRSHPLIVHTPAVEATTTASSTSADSSSWETEETGPVDEFLPAEKPAKPKASRPRSKSVFTTSNSKTDAPTSTSASPVPGTPSNDSARKRRRLLPPGVPASPSTPGHSMGTGPLATSSPIVASAPLTSSSADGGPAGSDAKSSLLIPGGPISTQLPILKPPVHPPASPMANRRIQAALNSSCPNCSLDLGKPWHLVDHMVQLHDAQLIRIHRMLKRPDGANGMTMTSQMFTDRQCCFCQLSYGDVQQSLIHIIRTHRSRLFECPDNGECMMTIELSCIIGQETTPKKFTVSVKVKRRTTSE